MKKRIASLFLIVCLMLCGTIMVYAQESVDFDDLFFLEDFLQDEEFIVAQRNYAVYRLGEERLSNEQEASDIRSALYDLFPRNRAGEIMHPGFYAGSYHDLYSGRLIVNISKSYANMFTKGNPVYDLLYENNVTINIVEFSYQELFDMLHYLDSVIINNPRSLYVVERIAGWGLPTNINRVVVRFGYNLEESVALFKETIIDSPMIVFEETGFVTFSGGEPVFWCEDESAMQNQLDGLQIINQIYDTFPINRVGDIVYPDFYGGAYFDSSGGLVILIVGTIFDEAFNDATFNALLQNRSVGYRLVDFSYAQLREIIYAAWEAHTDGINANCRYALNIAGIGLRTSDNRVVVRLVELNERKIAGFKSHVFASSALIFEQGYLAMRQPHLTHPFVDIATMIIYTLIIITIVSTMMVIVYVITMLIATGKKR